VGIELHRPPPAELDAALEASTVDAEQDRQPLAAYTDSVVAAARVPALSTARHRSMRGPRYAAR